MTCENQVTKGRELVVLVRTDDQLKFQVLGGIQERGITFDNPVEEITSSSTIGSYSESDYTGYSQATINLSGVADKRAGAIDPATGLEIINFQRLLKLGTEGNRCGYFRIISVDPDFSFFAEGDFQITNIELSGSTPGLLNDSATLQSGREVTVQVGN